MEQLIKEEGIAAESWLTGEAASVKSNLFRAVGWSLFSGLLIIIQARFLAHACHSIVIENAGIEAIITPAVSIALLAMLRGLITFLAESSSAGAGAIFKQKIRTVLYRRIVSTAPAGRVNENTSSMLETVTSGVDALEPYVTRFLPNLALAALFPPLVLIFIIPAEWRAGMMLLFSAPFIPLFMVLINRGSENLNRRQWSRLAHLSDHLFDLIQGLPDLKICSAAKREAESISRVSEEYRHSLMGVLRVAFLSALTLEFFTTVGTAVVAVTIGFRLLGGNLSFKDGLFVLLLAPEFYLPLRSLGLSYHSRMQGVAAAERIVPLLAGNFDLTTAKEGIPIPEGPITIEFSGVSFHHSDDRGSIDNIDLTLTPGSVTLLTGESGAGKTTLATLLLGLNCLQEGTITSNGIDLSVIDRNVWLKKITWVPQNPFFFKATVRENLLLGLQEVSDAQIRIALDMASADAFVDNLPSGLDTQLGDRGAGLSGGELRRLAMARAFLRNTPLVILDEPTAGLDSENEDLIAQSLKRLSFGRTVLIISHRGRLSELAGRVVLMDNGRIVQNSLVPLGGRI